MYALTPDNPSSMVISPTSVLAIILLLAVVCKYVVYPYFLSPLAKIPNAHFTSPISSRWIDSHNAANTSVLAIHSLHRKYGPVVRLGPNELSVNSLQGLRTIYTGAFEKDAFYQNVFVNFQTDNMVGMVHNQPHGRQKRMLSRVYSKSFLQESKDLRDISGMVLSHRLFPILDRVAKTGEAINVLPLFQAVGMDFTSSFLFGTSNGTEYVLNLPEWGQWLDQYEKFKYMSREERYLGFIESWCLSLCRRTERNDAPNDVGIKTNPVVYSQLHTALQKELSGEHLELAVASELLDHLVAGHETSGITFTYIMWELSRHPQMQRELRKELLTLTPTLQYPFTVQSSEGSLPTFPSPSAIDSMPLLDAIVRESLRLHSPVSQILPRTTPSTDGGISFNGYDKIPGGVRVGASAYTLHRIEQVYPNAEEWLPQRWLNPKDGRIHDMRRLWFPFGSGGRVCLGSNFALQGTSDVFGRIGSDAYRKSAYILTASRRNQAGNGGSLHEFHDLHYRRPRYRTGSFVYIHA